MQRGGQPVSPQPRGQPWRRDAQGPRGPGPSLRVISPQQNKMEDHLDEAIHVLRSHAVGTATDVHGLLPSHGALASGFAGPVMPLGGRHAGLVSAGQRWAGWSAGASLALMSHWPAHRLEAVTLRMALRAAAASCTTTRPSPASPAPCLTSLGRLTPMAVSSALGPGRVAVASGSPVSWFLLRSSPSRSHIPPVGNPDRALRRPGTTRKGCAPSARHRAGAWAPQQLAGLGRLISSGETGMPGPGGWSCYCTVSPTGPEQLTRPVTISQKGGGTPSLHHSLCYSVDGAHAVQTVLCGECGSAPAVCLCLWALGSTERAESPSWGHPGGTDRAD